MTLVAVLGLLAVAVAGDLQPPAAPGSTMKTLDEVEPRIPISQDDIPLTINQNGSYYLTEDLTATETAITVAVAGSYFLRNFLKDYQITRLIVFMNPGIDPQGAGWNVIQSMTAVGSGGLFGKGWLMGTQSHYRFLPQQSTDFIFSIIAEEWGFAGSLLVLALFSVLLARGYLILLSARDRYAALVSAGVVAMIGFHVFINIGMAMGIMPITGIPLFFLSYGGSSLWTALIGVGLLLNIHIRRYRY